MNLFRVMFVDFEACSLADDSWPVEVGVAWLEGERVMMDCSLIRPRPDWPESSWSSESEEIHGIPRSVLDVAPAADQVARWLAGRVHGRSLVSDAPEHDGRWLRQLVGDQDWAEVYNLHDALWQAFSADGAIAPGKLHRAYHFRRKHKPAHRAGADAAAHAYAWRAALRGR